MIRCSIGILAHNEGRNIERALHAVLAQCVTSVQIVEILVIASGCTDDTVAIAQDVAARFSQITVEVEPQRTGKASAIRRLMAKARGEVIVLVGADTLPDQCAIQHLVAPFADRTVGMTGARVIPLNTPNTWVGFSVQMLWHVHHQLALRWPKLGELVAFRNVVADQFPHDTATDEAAIEALLVAKGYRLVYVPEAVVYNRGPERADEFLLQRRRIFAGHLHIALRYRYYPSSMAVWHILPLAIEAVRSYPRFLLWTFAAMGAECWARLLGVVDALGGRQPTIWKHLDTTKAVTRESQPLTLIAVKWAPGSLDCLKFLKDLRRHSEPEGSVFWWDRSQGEILLFVGGDRTLEWFQERVDAVTRVHLRPLPEYSNTAGRVSVAWVKPSFDEREVVSCRLVSFSSPAANARSVRAVT